MEISYEVIIAYAVGTLFGLYFGARWGFYKGTLFGVTKTITDLDENNLLADDWQDRMDQRFDINNIPDTVLDKINKEIERIEEEEKNNKQR